MSLHDAYARLTPFELALQGDERVTELAESVEEEAEARGLDTAELGSFLTLGTVAGFVGEIAGEEADATALHRFGPLAYHGMRFHAAGRPLFVLSTHVARYLVEGAPTGEPRPPSESGYLQLPQHLFWTRAAGESPESVDGLFWSTTPADALHALLVTGVRPDRPGLGVVPLPPGPLSDAPEWMDLEAREAGADFATELPGAEIDGLYEIESAGEVFKLLGRFFAYVDASPDAVVSRAAAAESEASDPPVDGEGAEGSGPPPSRLDFVRVTLGDA